jgi:transcriptional regulator with XRE-family HTH domain
MPYSKPSALMDAQNPVWRILGQRYADLRNEKGYSLRGIARSLNVSPSLISNIENDKTVANVETLLSMYEAIGQTLWIDSAMLESFDQKLKQFTYAVYLRDEALQKSLIADIEPFEEHLTHSLLYVDFILYRGIHDIFYAQKEPSAEYQDLFSYYDALTTDQRDMLNALTGHEAFMHENYALAKSKFELIIQDSTHPIYLASAHTYLAQIHGKRFNLHRVIQHAREASRLNSHNNHLVGKIEMDILQLKALIELRQLNEAQVMLENLEYLTRHTMAEFQPQLRHFRAYIFYSKGLFHEALSMLEEVRLNSLFSAMMKVYMLEKLGRLEEAIQALKEARLFFQDDHKKHIIEAISFYQRSLEQYYMQDEDEEVIEHFLLNPSEYEHIDVVFVLFKLSSQYAYQNQRLELLKRLNDAMLRYFHYR